jgi:hypothetical protein
VSSDVVERKGDAKQVRNDCSCHVAILNTRNQKNVRITDDRHGLHSTGGVIGFFVGLYLVLDPEIDAAVVVLAWVWGPHSGVRLAHRTEEVLRHERLDGVVQGGILSS